MHIPVRSRRLPDDDGGHDPGDFEEAIAASLAREEEEEETETYEILVIYLHYCGGDCGDCGDP